MKQVILKELELTNYRNIDHAIYKFDGNSKIVGDNKIGKTNTLESIYFLLSNYLIDGSSDIARIKPLNDTKKVVSVKGTFYVDGTKITLEKQYGEDWVKTRGSTELVLKGHYETYIYNDVKQATEREYKSKYYNDFGIKEVGNNVSETRLIIDPSYLGNLGESKDWTNLRALIISIIGDVTDEQVFTANPKTAIIKDDLANNLGRVDQVKKQYKNQIDALNDQIIGNDAVIESLEKTECPTDEEIALAKKGIEQCDEVISKLKLSVGTDTQSELIEKDIVNKQREINELKAKEIANADNGSQAKINDKYNQINEVTETRTSVVSKISELESKRNIATDKLNELTNLRTSYLNELRAIDDRIRDVDIQVQTVCPTCHRAFKDDEIAKAKVDYIDACNKDKEVIIVKGKANKVEMEKLNSEILSYNNEIAESEKVRNDFDNKLARLRAELEELKVPTPTFKSSELEKLEVELFELNQKLRESKNAFANGQVNNSQAIYDEEQKKAPFQKVIDDKKYYDRKMEELAQARATKNTNERTLADFEQKKEMLDSFIHTKLQMLDENVSKVFGNIKFQLIKENLNGGFDPICKPYIYDIENNKSTNVSWASGSKSEKVVTGIAIAEKIKEKLGLPNFPFLFDEGGEISSETLNTRLKTNSQLICVKVQDNIRTPLVMKL